MKDTNYIINRDDVYVGKVVMSDTFRRFFDGSINTGSYEPLRSILFVLNENKYSEDLLFDSENYPVLNMTDDKICLSLDACSIVVKKVLSLAPLLRYFEYKEKLSYNDIKEIKKRFLNGKFTLYNCELFGYIERNSKLNKLLGDREFILKTNPILPDEYWRTLDMYGKREGIFHVPFSPHVFEKNVKKLVKTR